MKIKEIEIKNFKNMVEYKHKFDDDSEIIRAEFGGGKSTIFEAYKWVMGYEVSNFEPSIDKNLVKGVKTEVFLTFKKEKLEYKLYRSSMRKNGDMIGSFAFCGNPCKSLKEYKAKIENVFGISHADMEMLIDIKRFNATDTAKWTWKEQREFLFRILNIDNAISHITDKEKYSWIKEQFTLDKKLTEIDILRKLSMDKRTIEKQIDSNIAIYDNDLKNISKYKAIDFSALKKEKESAAAELDKLDSASAKAKKSEVVSEKAKEIDKLYAMLTDLNKQKSDFSREIIKKQRDVLYYVENNSKIISQIKQKDEEIISLKDALDEEEKMLESESVETICPYCGAELSEEFVSEKKESFERSHKKAIETFEEKMRNAITERKELLDKKEENAIEYGKQKDEFDKMKEKIKDFDDKISETESQIESIRNEMNVVKTADANAENKEKRKELSDRISEIDSQLCFELVIRDLTAEIDNLKESNRQLGIDEQKRLQKEDLVNEFINEKMSVVSEIFKEKFEKINFQFFKYNRTDGEQKNICSVLYNGSDFSQCSSGQKIALNFFLNESLQEIFKSDFPVWVDDIGSAKVFESNHQFIGLLTDNTKKLEYIRVRDKYTLDDCENLG